MSKTIEIDDAAYLRLEQARRPDEDWSAPIGGMCVLGRPLRRSRRNCGAWRCLRRPWTPWTHVLPRRVQSVSSRRRLVNGDPVHRPFLIDPMKESKAQRCGIGDGELRGCWNAGRKSSSGLRELQPDGAAGGREVFFRLSRRPLSVANSLLAVPQEIACPYWDGDSGGVQWICVGSVKIRKAVS